jgi:hypothetical protein
MKMQMKMRKPQLEQLRLLVLLLMPLRLLRQMLWRQQRVQRLLN